MKNNKLGKFYFRLSIVLFFITICVLVYYFWTFPETQVSKLKKVIANIIGILSIIGFLPSLKREFKNYWIKNLSLNIVVFFIWFLILPIHHVYFNIYPENTDIFLYKNKVKNPVHGLSARFYKFQFKHNEYISDSLLITPINVLFNRNIKVELKKMESILAIGTNVNNVNISIKNINDIVSKHYGSLKQISLKYGEYWVVGSKIGYIPDSALVNMNEDSVEIKLTLSKYQEKKYEVKLLTEPGTEISLIENDITRLLTTADINGYAKINIRSGTHTLLFKKNGRKAKILPISVPNTSNSRIVVPLLEWN